MDNSADEVLAAFGSWFNHRMAGESENDSSPARVKLEIYMLQSFLAGVSVGAVLGQKYSVAELLPHYIAEHMAHPSEETLQ